MRLVAEFTTEPFRGEGEAPEHARAALAAVQRAALDCDFGPLGTTVRGEDDDVVPALAEVLRAALAHGATRVTLQVEREEPAAAGAADG
jgi:uncharacterized protein YqgV (UPF0045/DUF77 family)